MKGLPGKTTKTKTYVYDEAYLSLSFASTTEGSEERPQCIVCLKVLASDSMELNKLRRHLETSHPDHKEKPIDFFRKNYSTVVHNRVALLKQHLCLQMINLPPTKWRTKLLSVKNCTQKQRN